jgi:RimJ/RimL family protein N-acetyltransferase
MPHLRTERLALRPFRETDIDGLVDLDSDPEVTRFINGGRPTARETVEREVLPRLLHRYPCLGTVGYWAAEELATGTFLGWYEFRPLEEDRCTTVELGYRLNRHAWGAGYATEGSRALIRKGFTEHDVQRVVATTMTVNVRSRRVMEKAGLTYVRTFFHDYPDAIEGSEHGEVEYALTRADWLSTRADQP